MKTKSRWTRKIALVLALSMMPVIGSAGTCSNKLFSTTIDSTLSIGDAIENLADTCNLTVSVNDEWAKKRLDKKLYFVKLNNTTLKGFLDTVLTDNDLNYKLNGDKLTISYLTTRTFRVHYIAGNRIGKSKANVVISQATSSTEQGGGTSTGAASGGGEDSQTSTSIENTDEFRFWTTVEDEVQRVLTTAADNAIHYTRAGDSWIGPDGKKWEYNPLKPIINPAAGMVTVTGTKEQINRVAKYINTLQSQIKTQVLIDVQIMSVSFDDSTTTGVDWNELYKLQTLTVNTYAMGQRNMASWTTDQLTGLGDKTFAEGTRPTNAGLFELSGHTQVADVVKFLATQGNVKTVSSPRVMTLNNQPALISAGKDIYYKLKTSTTVGDNAGAATEGEQLGSVFEGVLLDITPEVDTNGMVTLKINPSISKAVDAVSNSIGARDIPPDMFKRQMSAVIKVKDGHHAIMGGLIISQTGTKVDKVPLLGDLPLFEYAFKKEEKINQVEELVLIITPHVVRNSKDVSLRDLGYKRVNAE